MSSLFLMVTITDRRSTDAFLQLYEQRGVDVNLRTVGSGTAVRETLATLGLEKTEKAVLLAVVTEDTWKAVRTDLRRKMRIDVPGTGIAFTVPLSSIGGKRALGFLTEHQTLTWKEESTLKDTRYELLLVIANQGYTGSIMDAARAAGAGGGTVIHAKGTGMEGAAPFLGMELVNEKELVLIVSRTAQKNRITGYAAHTMVKAAPSSVQFRRRALYPMWKKASPPKSGSTDSSTHREFFRRHFLSARSASIRPVPPSRFPQKGSPPSPGTLR